MTYQETLHYLYNRLPMFQRVGMAAFKKDLTNTLRLCKFLEDPQHQFPAVHVAGTNGKGSVSHMLASVLARAGYKTGLYTSPHLQDFRERIRINGECISQDDVIGFVEKTRPVMEEIKPSFFEMTVAMAFDHFANENVDIAIIETGLGGRLDSTNVITPLLSVITNVSLDHKNMLGNTISAIAAEKAGIIKDHVPVVVGHQHPESWPVFERIAAVRKAPLSGTFDIYRAHNIKHSTSGYLHIDVMTQDKKRFEQLQIDLNGLYQVENILTTLHSIDLLNKSGYTITESHIREGLKNVCSSTGLRGRWEKLNEHPMVIADIAHNEAALESQNQQLHGYEIDKLHIVFGMSNDKDHNIILRKLTRDAYYYFCRPDVPRGMDADKLQDLAQRYDVAGEAYSSVGEAVENAIRNASSTDLVLITGSAFVVAEALDYFDVHDAESSNWL